MIQKYGLTPTIRSKEVVEQMLPDLLVLIDHFEGEDQDNTKLACAALANNMFGRKAHFVSCVTSRVLGAIKFYNKPRTTIACLKLFIAYAIKKKTKRLHHSFPEVYTLDANQMSP